MKSELRIGPVSQLHDLSVPSVRRFPLASRPSLNFSRQLCVPRYLTEIGLRNFLLDEERIGTICTKYRSANTNGWSFPPLAEAREAWERCYGTVKWDNPDAKEWGDVPNEGRSAGQRSLLDEPCGG